MLTFTLLPEHESKESNLVAVCSGIGMFLVSRSAIVTHRGSGAHTSNRLRLGPPPTPPPLPLPHLLPYPIHRRPPPLARHWAAQVRITSFRSSFFGNYTFNNNDVLALKVALRNHLETHFAGMEVAG